jgi:hypothetical protein
MAFAARLIASPWWADHWRDVFAVHRRVNHRGV